MSLEPFDTRLPAALSFGLISRSYYQVLGKKLKGRGIDRYYSILLLTHYYNECATQQQLGIILGIDKTSFVRMVEHLVRKNYVEKKVNPKDKRCVRLLLTEKGQALIPSIESAVSKLNAQMMQGLSEVEMGLLQKILKHIFDNVKTLR